MDSHLFITTEIGTFSIALDIKNAPETANYYKDIADEGGFDNSSIFRIVAEKNAEMRSNAKIEVVQLGIADMDSEYAKSLKHENTRITGLRHKKWTVSAARYDVGQNYPSFFICMRDEPELDYGGKRHPDGQGFAAFGKVMDGFDTVEALFSKAEETEYLENKIEIISVKVSYN